MPTVLEQLQYGFDRDSRRTWRRRALTTGEDNHYGYDGLSQVVGSSLGNLNLNQTAIGAVPSLAESFNYDPTANWKGYTIEADGAVTLDQHRVHDKGNRLTQIEDSPNPFLLDRVGRMTEMAPDASGNWNESLTLKWDAWSRITEVRRASDDSVLGTYTYDGLTRRMTRHVSGLPARQTIYSDTWRPLEERFLLTPPANTVAAQYLWGARHRDDLVRRDRAIGPGQPLAETRYVLMDYFSPAALTDETGAVTERYAFSAFGVRRILAPDFSPRSTSECDFDFAFQGQFLDTESGLLNYGYRYYSPFLGRWTAKDPIEEQGGLNLYGMVNNNAVDQVDLLGYGSFPVGGGPPQIFPSDDEAGKSAIADDKGRTHDSDDLNKRNNLQKNTNKPKGWFGWEYCGLICKKCINGKDQYITTGPRTDKENGSCNPDLAPCPDGWEKSGEHHSHPDDSIPSQNDHSKIPQGMNGYVGSGSGTGPDYKYQHTQQGKGSNAPLFYPRQVLR